MSVTGLVKRASNLLHIEHYRVDKNKKKYKRDTPKRIIFSQTWTKLKLQLTFFVKPIKNNLIEESVFSFLVVLSNSLSFCYLMLRPAEYLEQCLPEACKCHHSPWPGRPWQFFGRRVPR